MVWPPGSAGGDGDVGGGWGRRSPPERLDFFVAALWVCPSCSSIKQPPTKNIFLVHLNGLPMSLPNHWTLHALASLLPSTGNAHPPLSVTRHLLACHASDPERPRSWEAAWDMLGRGGQYDVCESSDSDLGD